MSQGNNNDCNIGLTWSAIDVNGISSYTLKYKINNDNSNIDTFNTPWIYTRNILSSENVYYHKVKTFNNHLFSLRAKNLNGKYSEYKDIKVPVSIQSLMSSVGYSSINNVYNSDVSLVVYIDSSIKNGSKVKTYNGTIFSLHNGNDYIWLIRHIDNKYYTCNISSSGTISNLADVTIQANEKLVKSVIVSEPNEPIYNTYPLSICGCNIYDTNIKYHNRSMGPGTVLYNDQGLTSVFNGNDKYYILISNSYYTYYNVIAQIHTDGKTSTLIQYTSVCSI